MDSIGTLAEDVQDRTNWEKEESAPTALLREQASRRRKRRTRINLGIRLLRRINMPMRDFREIHSSVVESDKMHTSDFSVCSSLCIISEVESE